MGILLALGAAIGWGASDFLGGLKSRSVPVLSVLLVSQTTALAVLAALVGVHGAGPPGPGELGWAAVAGAGEATAIAALYRGLSVGTMSVVASVAATAPVVPVAAGLVLGQWPTLWQAGALALAVTGVVITSFQPGAVKPAPGAKASFRYGLLAALGFGAFFLGLDRASETDLRWALLMARLTSVAMIATVVAVMAAQGERPAFDRRSLPVLSLIGILIVVADGLYALATTQGLVGVVAVVGSLHTIVTMVLARLVLAERLAPLQRIGIAASLCGVLALAAT